MTFLKAYGIRGLVDKNDWPRYTEEEPEMYEPEELDKLFKACDAEERLWFEFFLMTGVREQEAMNTYWSDINLAHATVRVSHEPNRGWTPKAYKEREIPIPAKLVKSLKAWKEGNAAAGEFQKILDHSGIVWNCPTGALARLGLARANALESRTDQGVTADAARVRALSAYRDFFALWKDADPDIPIFKQAKVESTALQRSTTDRK